MASASLATDQHRSDRTVHSGWMSSRTCPGPDADRHRPPSRGLGGLPVATLVAMKQAAAVRWALAVVAVVAQPNAAADVATAMTSLTGFTADRRVVEQALTISGRAGWITSARDVPGAARYSVTRAGLRALIHILSGRAARPAEHTGKSSQAINLALPPIALDRNPPLTAQQQRVAVLVARGLTSREVAAQLGCRQRTVDNHVVHILTKLGLANRHELARGVATDPQLRELMRLAPSTPKA